MKYFIKTFGCQMNKSDSEKIAGLLQNIGYNPSITADDANIVVFNTCCVRENAENKFYGHLTTLKNQNGDKTIVVAGCLAQREKEKLINKYGVDVALGPQSIDQLPELLLKKPSYSFKNESCTFPAELPQVRESNYSSWLPIITGCNNYCSYCAVPYVRGREKSLPLEKVIDILGGQIKAGVIEITLLGQNVNSYGRDLYGKPRFAKLLKNVSKIEGLKRIRFATSHPRDFDKPVVDVISENKNICNHIHLPVQSGSSRILKLMGRGYSKDDYINLVLDIRQLIPDVSITTDIMVGFPGETESDFNDTMDVVEKCRFDNAFTFIYSPRPGTKAFHLKEIDKNTTANRFNRLTNLVKFLALESNKALEEKTLEVIVEGSSKKDPSILSGRTDCNRLVHFKSDKHRSGDFTKVKINKAFSWYLTGENDG